MKKRISLILAAIMILAVMVPAIPVVAATNTFNANDITAIFWFCIALAVTVIGGFLSARLPRMWMRVLYVVLMLGSSLAISRSLVQSMMWN